MNPDLEFEDDDEIPQLVDVSSSNEQKVVPITILSGFLGSGKTTLLNKILTGSHGLRIAVIENEFSEGLGIEGMIAKSGVNGDNISNFFELNNGCICCTVKDSLLSTLEQLVLHQDRFDYIVIETTGMANPGPIISSFWTDDNLGSRLRIDGVICVVDSANIVKYLQSSDISYEVQQQISYADRILMNKADLVDQQSYESALAAVKQFNNFAVFGQSVRGNVDLDFVLAINSFSSAHGSIQGIYQATSDNQAVFCYPCEPANTPTTISGSEAGTIPEAHVKSTVSSLALRFDRAFDLKALQAKLDYLVYEQNIQDSVRSETTASADSSMKIYRMKGIIHIDGDNTLHVLQAVHNLFDLERSEYTKGSENDKTNGQSLLIIIGASLDESYLRCQLETACVSHV